MKKFSMDIKHTTLLWLRYIYIKYIYIYNVVKCRVQNFLFFFPLGSQVQAAQKCSESATGTDGPGVPRDGIQSHPPSTAAPREES